MRRGERDPVVLVPKLTVELADFQYQDDQLQVGRFELEGSASVKDPSARGGGRFQVSTLRASIADVTWPVVRPGRVDVRSSVPGGGLLNLTGQLSPPPAASQLRLRLERVDLGKWASLRAELPPRRGPRGGQSADRRAPRSRGAEPCARRDRGESARGEGCARGAAAGPAGGGDGDRGGLAVAARRPAARHHRAPGHDRAGQHRGHRRAVGPAEVRPRPGPRARRPQRPRRRSRWPSARSS